MTAAATSVPLDRRQLYALFLVLAAGVTLGRILTVPGWYGDNDGSRWLTAEALAAYGAYHIGERIEYPNGEHIDRGLLFTNDGKLRSNDVVLNPEPIWENHDARGSVPLRMKRFYSSKPPLLATLMGNLSWLLQETLGWRLELEPWLVVRTGLIVFNWLPFLLMLAALTRLIDRFGVSEWGRVFAVAAVCFGTFLTTFQTTINNHTLAAAAAAFALYFWLHADGLTQLRAALTGFWAGFAAANELPALAFVALLAADLALTRRWRFLPAFTLAAAVPLAAQAGLNWLALGVWLPAYAEFGTEWYNFPGSYWAEPKEIDTAAEPRFVYFCHLLVGHHGFFALTPALLFGLIGMVQAWTKTPGLPADLRRLARLALVLFLVVIVFYGFVTKTQNYGGWTVGPRWLFWLIPFFLVSAVAWLDEAAASPVRRRVGLLALGWSAFSAFAVGLNPWLHPWLFRWLKSLELVRY